MSETRTGTGYDAHRFGGEGPVMLGGVSIDHPIGVEGTSDADVAVHAVCDALLGAIAAGDLGSHFPSSDPQWHGVDSLSLLRNCADLVTDAGFVIAFVDVTVVAESLRVSPHRELMRRRMAEAMGVEQRLVSVKATTTDGLGWIGTEDGLAANAVATITS